MKSELVHNRYLYSLETYPPEDIINDDQGNLAVIASNIGTVKSATGLIGSFGSVVYLDDWNCTAGIIGEMRSRHSGRVR